MRGVAGCHGDEGDAHAGAHAVARRQAEEQDEALLVSVAPA